MGIFGGKSATPTPPAPPLAPPLPPQLPDSAVQSAGAAEAAQAAASRGMAATILTSGQGVPGGGQKFGQKTLLGS